MNSNNRILSTPISNWPFSKNPATEKQLTLFVNYLIKLGIDPIFAETEKDKIGNIEGIENYNMKMAALVWKFLMDNISSSMGKQDTLKRLDMNFGLLYNQTTTFMMTESQAEEKRVIGTNYNIKETRIYCEWVRYVLAFYGAVQVKTLSGIIERNVNSNVYFIDFEQII